MYVYGPSVIHPVKLVENWSVIALLPCRSLLFYILIEILFISRKIMAAQFPGMTVTISPV